MTSLVIDDEGSKEKKNKERETEKEKTERYTDTAI